MMKKLLQDISVLVVKQNNLYLYTFKKAKGKIKVLPIVINESSSWDT